MRNVIRSSGIVLAVLFIGATTSEARLIQTAFTFRANNNSDQSSISRTVNVLGINGLSLTFDLDLAISSSTGNVFDSTAGHGLSGRSGQGLLAGDSLTFDVSISNISSVGSFNLDFDSLSLRFLRTEQATSADDAGTVTTPAGSQSWTRINTGADFSGHVSTPDTRSYGGGLAANGTTSSPFVGTQGFTAFSNLGSSPCSPFFFFLLRGGRTW